MEKINFTNLTFNKGAFTAQGRIKDITSKSANKESKTGGRYFSNTTVDIEVNGKIQKIDFFGETIIEGAKDTREISVMKKTAEGKAERGADGKTLRIKVPVSKYDPKIHMFFDSGEIFHWKEREKITVKEFASQGDLANYLMEDAVREKLIGKMVQIKGKMDIKEGYNTEAMEFKPLGAKIQLMKEEEGKKINEEFTFTAPVVMNMLNFPDATMMNDKGLLPVDLSTFVYKDKANHTKPIPITLDKDSFFGVPTVPMETRLMLFKNLLANNSDNSVLVGFVGNFSYDNGYEERSLTMADIADDPTFVDIIASGGYSDEDCIKLYKSFHPELTFKKELVSKMSLIGIHQEKDKVNICPVNENDLPNGETKDNKMMNEIIAEVSTGATKSIDDEFPF